MQLAEYYRECRTDAERFYDWWLAMYAVCPPDFPLEMSPGDWHEQFLMFLSLEE